MEAKEKAKELMQKAYDLDQYNKTNKDRCKQICLLLIDEILQITPSVYVTKDEEIHNGHYQYWNNVKQEILNL